MKLSIILPVFNESAHVGILLHRVLEQPILGLEKEMVIVESNSQDGSREIVMAFADRFPEQVKLILQKEALGKGHAVRQGLQAATGDIILIQDGDLEYDVKDYPSLLQPILDGKAQFVLGSRHLSAGSWKIRKFKESRFASSVLNLGGKLFHGMFNLIYRTSLTDPTTMYKVFKKSCIQNLTFDSNRFDFDFELVAKLIRSGFIPLEVPISYVSRGFEEGKKIHVFRDPFTWVWAILKFRFCRV